MTIEERAETFSTLLKQLGYTKVNTGAWIEEIVDDGQGFPHTKYTCPRCGKVGEGTNFCPHCGTDMRGREE